MCTSKNDSESMTLRQFAAAHDPADWESFLRREDQAFLYADESGRNAVDYAMECKNYELMKYLLDQGIIWLISPDTGSYVLDFGAGTNMKGSRPAGRNDLVYGLREDSLRRRMIMLAIENRDAEMLPKLKARELPTLYGLAAPSCRTAETERFYDEALLRCIAGADEQTLDYFTQAFDITEHSGRVNTFLFPYIGQLLDLLIGMQHPLAGDLLERCAAQNRRVLDLLNQAVESIADYYRNLYDGDYMRFYKLTEKELYETSRDDVQVFANGDIIGYSAQEGKTRGLTTIVSIRAESGDERLSALIKEINSTHDKIMEFKGF